MGGVSNLKFDQTRFVNFDVYLRVVRNIMIKGRLQLEFVFQARSLLLSRYNFIFWKAIFN